MTQDRLAIQGIGLVGGFGSGHQAAIDAIANPTGPNNHIPVNLPDAPGNCPAYIADPAGLKEYLKSPKLRRFNKISKLATLATAQALQDANLQISCNDSRMAVVIASGYGTSTTTFDFLDNVILEGDRFASPTSFSNSVHSAVASNITILLSITGPTLTVTQFEMSTVAALLNVRQMLYNDAIDTVLFGTVDEVNPVLAYSYMNIFDGVPDKIEPLNFNKQTAIPGEGATCFVLTRDEGKASKYGHINDIQWHQSDTPLSLPDDTPLVISADGHRTCGLTYKKKLQGKKNQ
ncbi:MAG: hypothetical protein GY800_01220, partial [Planctomycetes bacterium]|nr:hypothetical protein [Planctomycetota bacterium]